MKKKFLTRINVLLGALVTVLVGCHTQKVKQQRQEVVCMYGVPQEVYEEQLRQDSLRRLEEGQSEHRVMLKYGVPRIMKEQAAEPTED